jgi:hypothetical protein
MRMHAFEGIPDDAGVVGGGADTAQTFHR